MPINIKSIKGTEQSHKQIDKTQNTNFFFDINIINSYCFPWPNLIDLKTIDLGTYREFDLRSICILLLLDDNYPKRHIPIH